MPRPTKCRKVCGLPKEGRFGPLGSRAGRLPKIQMSVEEFETIRLIDGEGLTQEEAAGRMGVSRTTVQGLYGEARTKLAVMLVEGAPLVIQGGDYELCPRNKGQGCCGGRDDR